MRRSRPRAGLCGATASSLSWARPPRTRSGEVKAVLCMLRYLEQEEVMALDGGLDNWFLASLPMETKENVAPSCQLCSKPAGGALGRL
ncbi:MAG TPA: hypothetical protein VMY43_05225 [Methanothrix sp.]|nr:hypothetical protein [Methanothrix sp.]